MTKVTEAVYSQGVLKPVETLLDRARGLHLKRNVAFWDAMILASCLDAGVNVLYSEDLPGGDVVKVCQW